jgi:hypothetical protein
MPPNKTKNDTIMTALVSGGHAGSTISDKERSRLIALTSPPNGGKSLSLYDLYKLAGERPRLP